MQPNGADDSYPDDEDFSDGPDPMAEGDPLDHLWNAAHEMLGALRGLLDAADEFVESQRARRRTSGRRTARESRPPHRHRRARRRVRVLGSRALRLQYRSVVAEHECDDRSRHRRYQGARRAARRRRNRRARGAPRVAPHGSRRAGRDRRVDRDPTRCRRGRCADRRGRGRARRSAGHLALRAEPAERARGAAAGRARDRDRPPRRRRQRRRCRDARRGDLRRRGRPPRRLARDARDRHRRRLPLRRSHVSRRAQLRRPRSGTSPSTPTVRCARAANAVTGRRSPRAPRSAGWRASWSPRAAARRWSRPRAATRAPSPVPTWVSPPPRATPTLARCSCSTPKTSRSGSRGWRTSSIRSASSSPAVWSSSDRCCSDRCAKRSPATSRVPRTDRRSTIVPAQLGERAGAIGAAVLARSLLS